MIETKRKIILSEGVPVSITDRTGNVVDTKALIGRANKQFDNTVSLETHRRGQFLPDVVVDSGFIVANSTSLEEYLTIAVYPEVVRGQLVSRVSHMFVCNCTVDIRGIVETATPSGQIKRQDVVKMAGQKAYVQALSGDLKQYEAGLHEDAEYRVFAPVTDVSLLDKLIIHFDSFVIPLKIVHLNFLTYSGIVVIQACSETRK